MFIASCKIRNFKSFSDSEAVKFTSGFNVIVGQNNVGKTALLEAMALKLSDNPHRSVAVKPVGQSSQILTLCVDSESLWQLTPSLCNITVRINRGENEGDALRRLNATIAHGVTLVRDSLNPELHFKEFPDSAELNTITVTKGEDWGHFRAGIPHFHAIRLRDWATTIWNQFTPRIYMFRAQRFNIGECPISVHSHLASDAQNLPATLHLLQSTNKSRYTRFLNDVQNVFPDIRDITAIPVENNSVRLNLWFVDQETEREDLAIPLADCGTGISQVLAMLYVLTTAETPLTLLIDEPQSFLHPGAIRKLFEIFKRPKNNQHQFVIATHSPTVVTAAGPCNVVLLRRSGNETRVETIDVHETAELRLFLLEIGARLADVFGADRILWVEGKTEEICFRMILRDICKIELMGTEILGVTQVGDLESRHKEVVLEIYQRLCKGRGLLPATLGFCFDQEGRTEQRRMQLVQESNGLMQFIPRRMYENYLLNPSAVAFVITMADSGRASPVTAQHVTSWYSGKGQGNSYISSPNSANWNREVNAAKVLNDLFEDLSDARVSFDKIKHGVKLTEWIIENVPTDLDELAQFLKTSFFRLSVVRPAN